MLARAKNTSVEKLKQRGVLYAEKGIVRLLTREEISKEANKNIIWLLAQQLTQALEEGGVMAVAKIVEEVYTSEPEYAKALAYRLFTLAERKGWAHEAYAYNSLIIAWQEIQAKATDLRRNRNSGEQMTFLTEENN